MVPHHRIVNSPYPVHNSPPKSRYPFLLNPKSLFIFLWKFGPWGYVHYGKSTDYFCTPHAPYALIDQRKTKKNKTFKLYSMTERNILATRLKRNCLFSSAYFTSSFLQKIHSEFKFALLVLRRDIKLQRMFNMETCNMWSIQFVPVFHHFHARGGQIFPPFRTITKFKLSNSQLKSRAQ